MEETKFAHFMIFGSLVYNHVSKEAKKKLESTTKLGIFVGYTDTSHNYPMYVPSLKMTLVIWDVKFDEEKEMRCSLERELQLQLDQELMDLKEEPQEVVEKP